MADVSAYSRLQQHWHQLDASLSCPPRFAALVSIRRRSCTPVSCSNPERAAGPTADDPGSVAIAHA
jgi:hypothetical protein